MPRTTSSWKASPPATTRQPQPNRCASGKKPAPPGGLRRCGICPPQLGKKASRMCCAGESSKARREWTEIRWTGSLVVVLDALQHVVGQLVHAPTADAQFFHRAPAPPVIGVVDQAGQADDAVHGSHRDPVAL